MQTHTPSDLHWYLNRLRCMPPWEIPFRILRSLSTRAEQFGLRRYKEAAPDLSRSAVQWLQPPVGVAVRRYRDAADRIMAGSFDVFALHDIQLGAPPRWNRDPKTGTEAPLAFGKLLDYRDPRVVGDIKYLWEPNRHRELVPLAQAYSLSHDPRYGNAVLDLLASWFDACPYGRGPNWASALEPAVRLINWSLAWQLLGGAHSPLFSSVPGHQLRGRWLRSIHQHAHFIRGFFSLHSSANNHLIGEAAGLLIAAHTWPHWPETASWQAQSHALLLREALLQNAPDGVNREQAVGYQLFELDLLLLAWLAGNANGTSLPAQFTARLIAMLEYLASIMDAGGHLPMFGDSDDGSVVMLSQEPDFCPARSLLATGAVLFDRADLRAKAGRLDDKTRWLLGATAVDRFSDTQVAPVALPVRRAFPDGGSYILGCDFETAREIRLVMDAGPLGYGGLAAHGHADALSFTLSIGGREVLVDPGTCTYRPDSPWRAYFRGTSAHNTVRVDGQDQAESGGNFMWLRKTAAQCTTWLSSGGHDLFEGQHDGYTRLPDPVVHRRRINLDKRARCIVIEDELQMSGTHAVELFFHCNQDCRVTLDSGDCLIEQDDLRIHLQLPAINGSRTNICRGQVDPPLGWISRRFDHRVPAPTLAWMAQLAGPARLTTTIQC